ncbi:MAG: hypothetical protein QOG00_2296, partial [Pyrinomonadaceae bacterium]|nr:hypothetical protein [Pyrinomonadaceae bacterium]
MDTCLDEGTLQAYLDGELSPDVSNGVAAHLAACAPCAEAARAAEQELALFSEAYAPALSAVSVPTEKLRARLDEAIAELNAPQRGFAETPAAASPLRAFFGSLVASITTFTPRQASAFASFLVAVALLLVYALMQTPDRQNTPNTPQEIAQVNQTPAPPVVQSNNTARNDASSVQTPGEEVKTPALAASGERRPAFVKAGLNARAQASPPAREGRDNAAEVATTT